MKDRLGRNIEYLRISVTQNCNLKCIYCSPDEAGQKCPVTLTPQEMEKIVKSMARLGIRYVRVTGGEPLMRSDICEIVKRISDIEGIEDISITTNGTNLDRMAEGLKEAGLTRLNISLDSLREDRFRFITGGGRLESTLKGMEKAIKLGLNPVKINTVLIKGVNDDEIDDFINLTRDRHIEVRFIEMMPIGRFGEQNTDKVIYNSDIIQARPELIFCEQSQSGSPAVYYKIEGYRGRVGFISPLSHKFCSCCNRIRLTCDGKIKPCLGNNGETDITGILREHPEELDAAVEKAIFEKPEGHNFGSSFTSIRNMSMIGG